MPVVNTTEDRAILNAIERAIGKSHKDNLSVEILFELLSMKPSDRTKLAERLLCEPHLTTHEAP